MPQRIHVAAGQVHSLLCNVRTILLRVFSSSRSTFLQNEWIRTLSNIFTRYPSVSVHRNENIRIWISLLSIVKKNFFIYTAGFYNL
jgi:hypothetical protein